MTVFRIVQALLLLSLLPATAYAVLEAREPQINAMETRTEHPASTLQSFSLSIQAKGNATALGNPTRPETTPALTKTPLVVAEPAPTEETIIPVPSFSVTGHTVPRNESAVLRFNITGGSFSIQGASYTVSNGTGIFNQHSLVVVIHASVASGSNSATVILIGHADSALSAAGSVGITFDSPQSKLAGLFFLSLKGTVTLS